MPLKPWPLPQSQTNQGKIGSETLDSKMALQRNWKLIAVGLNLDVPDADLEKAQASLEKLEKDFRPLVGLLSPETEPAFRFECPSEEEL